ncbi:MAG: glucokinase [Glaciecola sp.]|jgi:glucokinase
MRTVGVDLGGTNMQVVVLDEQNDVLGEAKLRTPTMGARSDVMDVMYASVTAAVDNAGLAMDDIAAIGVGTPGLVVEGTVGGATNVPGWAERFSLVEVLTALVDKPIRVANDVNAAAIAEHRLGAGQGHDDLLVVFAGTGVGAGLVLSGSLYEGARGGAGEFGHAVVQLDGAVCPCGRRGCIEAYVGRAAMERTAQRAVQAGQPTILFDVMAEMDKPRATSGVFLETLRRGDPLVADMLDAAVSALAAGIASAANLLDVGHVVLGGGLADKLGNWMLLRVQSAMTPQLFLQPSHLHISPAILGDKAGALGAAILARELG